MISWTRFSRRLFLALPGLAAAAPTLAGEARPHLRATPADPVSRIWVSWFGGQRIWAYTDRLSLDPGQPLAVMASTGPGEPQRRVRLEVFRIGASGPEKVWVSDFTDVKRQSVTASAAAIGPGWPPTWSNIDTSGWRPGVYTADIVEQTTATRDVRAAQWIVRNPARNGAVLLRLGTNTWAAYNEWGGHSLYPAADGDDDTRGLMVSFDRPLPPDLFEYEAYLVQWLEGLAPTLGGVDYASNFDVHVEPKILDPYPLVITGSHDEYWSKEEFDAFQRRIFKRGKNVCFFGANTAYCQVRYGDLNAAPEAEPQGRQLICYKDAWDPVALRADGDQTLLTTNMFRTNGRRPESQLVGGAFQSWFEPATAQKEAMFVESVDLPFFDGVGWKAGDLAAEVVGYEWDNRDPQADGKHLLTAASAVTGLEADQVKVLFKGHARDVDGNIGTAESTYFRSQAGAQVFNAGCIRWAWGLGKPGFVNDKFLRFNENLVRALARRH
jgi:hypothetical protein